MPAVLPRPGRRGPHMKHLHLWLHEDIVGLLAEHCETTPRGRTMGLAQLVTQCIVLVLGKPKRRRKADP